MSAEWSPTRRIEAVNGVILLQRFSAKVTHRSVVSASHLHSCPWHVQSAMNCRGVSPGGAPATLQERTTLETPQVPFVPQFCKAGWQGTRCTAQVCAGYSVMGGAVGCSAFFGPKRPQNRVKTAKQRKMVATLNVRLDCPRDKEPFVAL